jgi:glycosyltransferase involved in cell wall biosynthesis
MGRFFSNRPARILYNAQSIADQHEAIGYSARKRAVIPNGIDVKLWSHDDQPAGFLRSKFGISDQDRIVGMIARFDPQKDFDTFLEAAREIRATTKNVHFVLIGPGVSPREKKLTRLISHLHLLGVVHLLGEQKDVRPYLRDFDVFMLSSKNGEAFPNVLLEAMSMAIPVVATDVGDCREIIGETGAVVAPSSPRALAHAASDLLSKSSMDRRALGLRERKRVKELFSIDNVTQAYVDLYRDLRS